MAYKTILVHVDKSRRAEQRMELAASIAARQNAHLIGAAMTGISRYAYQSGALTQADPHLTDHLMVHLDLLRERAREGLQNFERIARNAQVRSYESPLIDDAPNMGISLRARYSDLTVIGQFDPDGRSSLILPNFPEYVVMNSGRPVLIVPFAGQFNTVGRKIMIAWDGSVAATRAVNDALPLLQQADIVYIAVFDQEPDDETHGDQPGDDIALFLARHDVKVEVTRETTKDDIGNALLSLAADVDVDMIVMGGYGHSRFSEILLGGTTRTMLKSMTVPVLMSH
ncbi:universal stress protein [Noviherbaspirillum saxi]|uniref:Universal stress protein n=1 Tax=Noviherbaspirillum saxi TaxID=2320863 RepID=A0A3A3FL38_9BURK|nr:universal stress protein [Noviherbaspirillum saxi]RJF96203.1 universal stress protein [Noviherbaspirillum saxi]